MMAFIEREHSDDYHGQKVWNG